MKVHEVFGIQPELRDHSYIDRGNLDREFMKLLDRQQAHIAIRGASKSGKSWLRQKVLADPIIVQCRIQYTTLDVYRDALARLDIKLEIETSTANKLGGKVTAMGEAGFKLLAKVQGAGEVNYAHESVTKEQVVGKDITDLEFIAKLVRESGRTLVIEDFHYLPVAEQRHLAFDLKTLWDYKTFVVIVGVWVSENMLITLNPDLSDRIEELSVSWTSSELRQVLDKGCEALNLSVTNDVASLLCEISYGSVGLLQKLALRLIDDEIGITEAATAGPPLVVGQIGKVPDAAMHVAEQLNQLYQTFAKRVSEGIRKRNNATGIYAHSMAAIMAATDGELIEGLNAKQIFAVAHARQPRILLTNLRSVLSKFAELQVDSEGRGLVLAYDSQGEVVSVVDRQLLLYRRYATVRWPWEDLIKEADANEKAFEGE